MELIERVEQMVDAVREELAPDARTSVFDIGLELNDGRITLHGAVSEPAALEELHRRIATLDSEVEVQDRVRRLPDLAEGARAHALVRAAVAPMLAGPIVSETHLSQALHGHRLLVLRERGRWLQCRSEDGYLGWVHRGYVLRVDETEARAWELGAGGELCLSLGARVLGPDGDVLARLPWGARLVRTGDHEARLPDGTVGRLEGEWLPLAQRAARFPTSTAAVVETASSWVGAPYLWGGITPAGVDCSGFVQAVYRLHGVELPRDSDQQARAGDGLDPGKEFEALAAGDLLFFAEQPERITHVALSLGGSRILHSSLGNGGVQRNDLLGELPYEQELRRLFVCARRVLNP